MKRLSKKLFTIMLIAVMLLSSNVSIFAESISINTKENAIISQSIALDKSEKIQEETFSIVTLTTNNTDTRSVNNANTEITKAIQSISTNEDGLVKVTTIFPYKCLASGELINSFEYTPAQTRNTSTVPTEFVDTTITVIAYYAQYFSWDNIANFYRHAGIEAYWSSDNASANVSNMYVIYDSAGELYEYPECLTENLSSTLVDDYYFIRSTIDENNPAKDQVYIDGNNTMALDRVLLLTDYTDHGGLIYLKLTYSVNGTNYTHDRSIPLYSK